MMNLLGGNLAVEGGLNVVLVLGNDVVVCIVGLGGNVGIGVGECSGGYVGL